jgi:hypothetical protein
MDAKLIAARNGNEIHKATRKAQTWPGWICPLGKTGYWVGNHMSHSRFADREALNSWLRACNMAEI